MSLNEALVPWKLFAQVPELSEKALITAAALAFLFLHILAGTILQNATASQVVTPQEEAKASFYD